MKLRWFPEVRLVGLYMSEVSRIVIDNNMIHYKLTKAGNVNCLFPSQSFEDNMFSLISEHAYFDSFFGSPCPPLIYHLLGWNSAPLTMTSSVFSAFDKTHFVMINKFWDIIF